jgi:epoxyqueuosine reductase QueG
VPAPPASELSVVSVVMPITRATKDENAGKADWTSERWAQTRLLGEIFSQVWVRELVTFLMDRGVLAISPDVTPMFNKKRYPKVGWASPWSHRHMAYAAGLGTFGLHDFLITEKGCAHRLASFVVHKKLEPNRKRPDDIHAYCNHFQGIECMKCQKRCPIDAVPETGHDKEACYQRVANSLKYCNRHYHIFIYGCGLCATGVPCESGIPKGLSKDKA